MRNLSMCLLLAPAVLLAGCSSGSSGGGGGSPAAVPEVEPNDTSATALALKAKQPGVGDVDTAGDVDYWSAALKAGWVVSVRLDALSAGQDAWDMNTNMPRLTLYDTDGTSRLLEHDYGGFTTTTGSWDWGAQDLDFPLFYVPADGTYYIAVTQDDQTIDGGPYGVRWQQMNLGTLQMEVEPKGMIGGNDDFMTAEPINPGNLLGWHVDDEEDYFSFTVGNDGALVRFELTTYRNGVSEGDDDSLDPEMYLYDIDGITELDSDDDSFYYDSAIQYVIVNPGTYFVNVTECCGEGDAAYFLNFVREGIGNIAVENEPNDTIMEANSISYGLRGTGYIDAVDVDYFKFSGTAGDMVRLQVFDEDNAQGVAEDAETEIIGPDGVTLLPTGGDDDFQTLTTILQETGTHYIEITSPVAVVISEYGIELTRFKNSAYETEPNNDPAMSQPFGSTGRRSGVIDVMGDVDVFSFSATQDKLQRFSIYASNSPTGSDGAFEYSGHGSDLEPILTIRDAMGVAMASSTSNPPNGYYTESTSDPLPTAHLAFWPMASGTYYLEVADEAGNSGTDYYYVVEQQK